MKTANINQFKLALIALTFLLSGSIYAQHPGGQRGGQQGPPPIPTSKQIKAMVSDLAEDISLTNEQETSVLKLYIAHFAEVKEKTSGNSRPGRKEMEALKSEFEKEVKTFLTDEQQSKYDAYLKKNARNRPGR